jgi:hypothetical protein
MKCAITAYFPPSRNWSPKEPNIKKDSSTKCFRLKRNSLPQSAKTVGKYSKSSVSATLSKDTSISSNRFTVAKTWQKWALRAKRQINYTHGYNNTGLIDRPPMYFCSTNTKINAKKLSNSYCGWNSRYFHRWWYQLKVRASNI